MEEAHRLMPTLSLKPYSGIFSSVSGSGRALTSCFVKSTDASTLGDVGYIGTGKHKKSYIKQAI